MQKTPVNHYQLRSFKSQKGAALIVSLVILGVVTVLGIVGMQSSNTELKLAASMRDRGIAFEAAEAALVIVEEQLANDPPNYSDLYSDCSGANCFNATCVNGLCFDGEYPDGDTELSCIVAADAGSSERVKFWSDSALDVWNSPSKHKVVNVIGVDAEVKYITEFLCYVEEDVASPFNTTNPNDGAPLFRITVMAKGNGNRASVALQSTYKVITGS